MDHVNGCRDDNRIENLRLASHLENAQNRKKSKANTSGFTGVTWHKPRGKWHARIGGLYLGLYDDIDEAHLAYLDAKKNLHTFHPNEISR
jgi:hypothetical protein